MDESAPTGDSAAVGVGDGDDPAEVESFLARWTTFLLSMSAEGTLSIRHDIGQLAQRFGVRVEALILTDSAVLTLASSGRRATTTIVSATPGASRLDLVSEEKTARIEIVESDETVGDASRRLDALAASPAPYPWWLRLVGVVLFSVGFAPSVQATWREIGTTIVLGAVMGVLFVTFEGHRRGELVLPLVGPFVVTFIAFSVLGVSRAPGGPILAVIPALFVLIPGDFLAAAAEELASGQLSAGAIRLVQAGFVLVQLGVGVVLAAEVSRVGTSALFEADVNSALPAWLLVVAWLPFTLGLVLTFNARIGDLGWMMLLVYAAWLVQIGVVRLVGATSGTFVAATVLGLLAEWLSRSRERPPRLVLLIGGFFVLTVGSSGLRALTTVVGGDAIDGFRDLTTMVTQTTALTMGLVAGGLLLSDRLRATTAAPDAAQV